MPKTDVKVVANNAVLSPFDIVKKNKNKIYLYLFIFSIYLLIILFLTFFFCNVFQFLRTV